MRCRNSATKLQDNSTVQASLHTQSCLIVPIYLLGSLGNLTGQAKENVSRPRKDGKESQCMQLTAVFGPH